MNYLTNFYNLLSSYKIDDTTEIGFDYDLEKFVNVGDLVESFNQIGFQNQTNVLRVFLSNINSEMNEKEVRIELFDMYIRTKRYKRYWYEKHWMDNLRND